MTRWTGSTETNRRGASSMPCGAAGLLMVSLLILFGSCREAAATPITAAWRPSIGDWTDPRWTFSSPTAAVFPNNGGGDYFSVLIDRSATANSRVTLNRTIEIDRLAIGAGDLVRLTGGGALRFAQDAARPGSGELEIGRGGSIVGSGFLGGGGPAVGAMSLNNRGGSVLADTGVLTINPSGATGTASPPVTLRNGGAMAAQNPGSTLLLRNSFVQQSRRASLQTILGGDVVLEDSVVQGGTVRVAQCTPPLVCGELQLNRGSVVQGTNVVIAENGVVRVLASAFPGGTLPARMAIQGGSVLVEEGPINPVTLTLDAGAGAADVINFSDPDNPANPGRIVTNWPSAFPVPGASYIRISQGDIALQNRTWPGGAIRGGIFLRGLTPEQAVIGSDQPSTAARVLNVGVGTTVANEPGRSGWIVGPGTVGPNNLGPVIVNVLQGGAVAALGPPGGPPRGGLRIGALNNRGGDVLVDPGASLDVSNFDQGAGSTVIKGTAVYAQSFAQTDGVTTIAPGGVLRAQEIEIQGGRISGDILSNFLLDGTWDLQIRDLLDFDRVAAYDDPNSQSTEGIARVVDGSTILVNLLFDAQVGDTFDILTSDLLNVNLNELLISDPFADGRFFQASIIDFLDPVHDREREALRLTVAVPEPPSLALVLIVLGAVVAFRRTRGGWYTTATRRA